MSEPERPVCRACGKTVTDPKVTPEDEVVVEAEAAAVGLEEVVWVCDDCFRLAQQRLGGPGIDGATGEEDSA